MVTAGAALLPLLVTGAPAAAQSSAPTRQLRWDPAVDVAVTAGGAAAWIASEILKGDLAASRCRWCATNPVDTRVRDALVWPDTATADRVSDVTGFVLAPVAALGMNALAAGHEGAAGNVPEDALLVAEASVIATDVSELSRLVVGRERPYARARSSDGKPATGGRGSDDNVSFFSGHTTEAFALAAASGTVDTMRGYRWAPLAWGVGGVLAVTTAYLRIAADRHWFTDVIVGVVVGIGIGIAVPYVFHGPVEGGQSQTSASSVRSPLAPAGTALTFAW